MKELTRARDLNYHEAQDDYFDFGLNVMCAAKTATGVGLEAPQCEGWPKKCLRLRIAVWLTEVRRHRTGLLHGSIVHTASLMDSSGGFTRNIWK